ncbi:MAG TPA: DUF397 domain-containing protein [Streptomyces sp.]|nr:DUF397 domain-containing protein [Streptomyces sp.]
MSNLTGATWRKSSHSGINGGACVEIAGGVPGAVPVRDSKEPRGPVLVFPAGAWEAFVEAVKGDARGRGRHPCPPGAAAPPYG